MDLSASFGETADNMGQNRGVSWAYGTETGERGHLISSLEYQKIDPIDYDPLELGDWFRRYGIVANPAFSRRQRREPAAAARAARRAFAAAHADGQDRRGAQRRQRRRLRAAQPPSSRSPGKRSRTTAPACGRS